MDHKNEKFKSKRNFIRTAALLGGTALLTAGIPTIKNSYSKEMNKRGTFDYPLANPENILYSACLQCTVACSIKVKLKDGIAMKIDGNPYSAMTLGENISEEISPMDMVGIDGKLCLKGQAGIQHAYDPYRLTKVLKRNGPRGSGKWKSVPFNQAVDEIVNGGKIFKEIGENYHVEGLKDIYSLTDPKLAKEMAADIEKLRKKEMSLSEFKTKHKDNLHILIDSDHPDLGPKNNQFLFQVGRIHNGRKEFSERFVNDSFGSVNWIEKTSICGQTSNRAWAHSTMEYVDGKWIGGVTAPRPDHQHLEFLLVFGTIIFEANYGPVQQTEPITDGLVSGRLKLAVVDPRLTKVASKAWKWLPANPGTDAAIALGMIRWIIENKRYDEKYLQNATKMAMTNSNEASMSDATYLVKIEDERVGKLLRANEIGIGSKEQFVVIQNGKPIAVNPDEANHAIYGEIFVSTEINGINVKSTLELVKEEAFTKSIEEWATIAGVKSKDIEELANEFTSHGKKAAVEFYRGPIKHTNGWYNAQALILLNYLIGNPNWKGGLSNSGGNWSSVGDKEGQPYPLKEIHPNQLAKFGIPITKEGWKYEESTLFTGYPSKRPWYPFSKDVAQETWPAVADGYPYPIKAALISSHSPMYSIPGGQAQLKTLLDYEKVPLLLSCDIIVGDTSQYSDYIFPDITYLERWGTPGQSHHTRVKVSQIRQPVIQPLTETVTVFGEEMPISLEALMMAIAERLHLSGFGANAFGAGMNLYRMEDYYLKLMANICSDGENSNSASPEEIQLFKQSRTHLGEAIYDYERWEKAVTPDEWIKIVYLLNRGGRFASSKEAYEGNKIKKIIPGLMRFYLEEIAETRNAISGNYFFGYPTYRPIMDIAENRIDDEGDLHLITYKEVFGTQSRTISNYWSQLLLQPENYVVVNQLDAKRLNLTNGDLVKVTSKSNPAGEHLLTLEEKKPTVGKLKVVEGIRPGVVAISTHFGHWGYGARDIEIDGLVIKGELKRGLGIHPNPLFRLDDNLRGTTLSEPIGGSASFFDTKVNIERV